MLKKKDSVPWVSIVFDNLVFLVFRAVLLEVPSARIGVNLVDHLNAQGEANRAVHVRCQFIQ
jgi:hypothetical protein